MYPVRDIEVVLLASADIQQFKAEYTNKEANKRALSLAYTTPQIDINTLTIDTSVPTLASRPTCTSTHSLSSQDPCVSTSIQYIKFTQSMLLKIGCLAKSSDTWASILENSVLGVISRAIELSPMQNCVIALTFRVTTCEHKQRIYKWILQVYR